MPLRPRHPRGFTLIELLVVLVIIGVLLSVAVLSIGDGGKQARLREEGRRLAALIELASDSAVLEGREWGVRAEADGYTFVVLREGGWAPASAERLFRPRRLAAGFSLELYLDELRVSLPAAVADATNEATEGGAVPQLLLQSSGERTPFRITLIAPEGGPQLDVVAPSLGKVVVYEPASL